MKATTVRDDLEAVARPSWMVTNDACGMVVLSLLDGAEVQAQLRVWPNDALLLAQQLISMAQQDE